MDLEIIGDIFVSLLPIAIDFSIALLIIGIAIDITFSSHCYICAPFFVIIYISLSVSHFKQYQFNSFFLFHLALPIPTINFKSDSDKKQRD